MCITQGKATKALKINEYNATISLTIANYGSQLKSAVKGEVEYMWCAREKFNASYEIELM